MTPRKRVMVVMASSLIAIGSLYAYAGSDLREREGCPPRQESSLQLCTPGSGSVHVEAFRSVRNRLSAGVTGAEALCEIDRALVRAQHECSFSQHVGDAELIAGLMRLLAARWTKEGDFERADRFYQRAYELDDDLLGKMAILQGWANLKLLLGDSQRATELANLGTTSARRARETGEMAERFSANVLIDALRFQASVLDRLGRGDEAKVAEEEANALAAQQAPCTGLCDWTMKKIK